MVLGDDGRLVFWTTLQERLKVQGLWKCKKRAAIVDFHWTEGAFAAAIASTGSMLLYDVANGTRICQLCGTGDRKMGA